MPMSVTFIPATVSDNPALLFDVFEQPRQRDRKRDERSG
jgi:hypothetical protein